MQAALIQTEMRPGPELRRHARGIVCAHAHVVIKGETSEHVTHDISLGGVRLCGMPHGEVGDEARLAVHLPAGTVRGAGRLVRVGAAGLRGEFAVRFTALDDCAEGLIHAAVLDALSQPDPRTILSVQRPINVFTGWDWLAPVGAVCVIATTTLQAVAHMRAYPIRLGIVAPGAVETPEWAWSAIYPQTTWRCIDGYGRLHVPPLTDAA
jgi:hypothetical protein